MFECIKTGKVQQKECKKQFEKAGKNGLLNRDKMPEQRPEGATYFSPVAMPRVK